jgi:ABC-type Fe3+ transport system permease subunit
MSTPPRQTAETRTNPYAVAAIVLGIVGVIFAFIPYVGVVLGGIVGLAGVAAGLVGRQRAADATDPKENRALATSGTVASAVALAIVVLQVVGLFSLTDITVEQFTERVDSIGNYVPGVEPEG